jgi:GNAT superfamily N-acetyltransferase
MEKSPVALSYPVTATLRDGRTVVLRPVTPASKPLIAAAMARLSPESSRRRFFTVRYRLSDAEFDRMTALDGTSAFAIGAAASDASGRTQGVGVARYARDADDPTTAELAIIVVDEYQGLGLGKLLITRLVAEAHARGIDRLRAIVLPDNDLVIGMLRKHAPMVEIRGDGDHLIADIPTRLSRDPGAMFIAPA